MRLHSLDRYAARRAKIRPTWSIFSQLSFVVAAFVFVGGSQAFAATIVDPNHSLFTGFTGTAVAELSGITYAGGNSYYGVTDNTPQIVPLTIGLNTSTAAVTSVAVGTPTALRDSGGTLLAGSFDAEDIFYDSASGKLLISNESQPGLSRHVLATGNADLTRSPATGGQWAVFASVRANRGFEALARNGAGTQTWLANEEALTVDGPVSTGSAGTIVRLQRLDAALNADGQFAYVTDPHMGVPSIGAGVEISGVSAMTVLPDGTLIVLERAVGGAVFPGFRHRIYAVNFAGATDVSSYAALDGGPAWTGVGKTLLWEKSFAFPTVINFEGMTLGPQLDNGDYSLLLVSDNQNGDGGALQGIYSLRVQGVPEPSAYLIALGGIAILMIGYRRKKRLAVSF